MTKDSEFAWEIPPAVRLLMTESLDGIRDGVEFRRRFDGSNFLREVADQAEWALHSFDYEYSYPATQFAVVPSSGLDPFAPASCTHPQCSTETALELARTLGPYADTVFLPDTLSLSFAASRRRLSLERAGHLLGLWTAVKVLQPLIECGAIRFFEGSLALCRDHFAEARKLARRLARDAMPEVAKDLTFRWSRNVVTVSVDRVLPLGWIDVPFDQSHSSPEKRRQLAERAVQQEVQSHVFNGLYELSVADSLSATYVCQSPAVTIALRRAEGRTSFGGNERQSWERAHSVRLPNLERLDVDEICRLRHECRDALRRLHEFIRARASANEAPERIEAELQEQAAEVEAALNAAAGSSERRFYSGLGLIGTGITVYGTAAGMIAPGSAFASLLTLLGIVHAGGEKQKRDDREAKSRPGYVLIKAADLIRRRPEGHRGS